MEFMMCGSPFFQDLAKSILANKARRDPAATKLWLTREPGADKPSLPNYPFGAMRRMNQEKKSARVDTAIRVSIIPLTFSFNPTVAYDSEPHHHHHLALSTTCSSVRAKPNRFGFFVWCEHSLVKVARAYSSVG
jgi:hypothetical protein